MDLFKFDIGPECHVEAKIVEGKAALSCRYVGQDDVSVQLVIYGGPKAALDKLKSLIPGTIDDMAIDALSNYLGLK